ncbi:hypothetical protein ACPA9J_17925 [Pseudomonas aeruginosa]
MFYIDEDSWNPLLAVDSDKQGQQIWKVRAKGSRFPCTETGACDVCGPGPVTTWRMALPLRHDLDRCGQERYSLAHRRRQSPA